MEVDNTNMSRSPNTSLDESLDTEVYPQERWVESETWAKKSYTVRYLEYKVEVEQVDLTNHFHIVESNLVRSRLVKKQKKKDKVGVEGLNMETDGGKVVDTVKEGEDGDDEDGNYLD